MLCAVCEGELAAADEAPDAVEMRQLLDGCWATNEQNADALDDGWAVAEIEQAEDLEQAEWALVEPFV